MKKKTKEIPREIPEAISEGILDGVSGGITFRMPGSISDFIPGETMKKLSDGICELMQES